MRGYSKCIASGEVKILFPKINREMLVIPLVPAKCYKACKGLLLRA